MFCEKNIAIRSYDWLLDIALCNQSGRLALELRGTTQ